MRSEMAVNSPENRHINKERPKWSVGRTELIIQAFGNQYILINDNGYKDQYQSGWPEKSQRFLKSQIRHNGEPEHLKEEEDIFWT